MSLCTIYLDAHLYRTLSVPLSPQTSSLVVADSSPLDNRWESLDAESNMDTILHSCDRDDFHFESYYNETAPLWPQDIKYLFTHAQVFLCC